MVALSVGKKGAPTLLVQGGIHAGEIDGKDAGFLVLRELLDGKLDGVALDKIRVVFVPVFNVDGHERFGAHNRPNQVGPEEMGWRTTAQNLNLNRDYVKAEAPEMRAMLKLFGARRSGRLRGSPRHRRRGVPARRRRAGVAAGRRQRRAARARRRRRPRCARSIKAQLEPPSTCRSSTSTRAS